MVKQITSRTTTRGPDIKTKYQKADNAILRAKLKEEYSHLRNKYITNIRNAKHESWQSFITITGNGDP